MNGSSVLRNYPRNCTMPWNEANRDTESWCVSVTADSAREVISTEQNWWRSGRLLRNGRPFEAAAVACRLWLWPDRQGSQSDRYWLTAGSNWLTCLAAASNLSSATASMFT